MNEKEKQKQMDPKLKESIKKFIMIEDELDKPEYIVNTLFPKTRKGFADGISLQLNDMVDSFFGYLGTTVGASIGGYFFFNKLNNKLRNKLKNYKFFRENYRFRYFIVSPIVAVPGIEDKL
eukprot:gene1864-1005_t